MHNEILFAPPRIVMLKFAFEEEEKRKVCLAAERARATALTHTRKKSPPVISLITF